MRRGSSRKKRELRVEESFKRRCRRRRKQYVSMEQLVEGGPIGAQSHRERTLIGMWLYGRRVSTRHQSRSRAGGAGERACSQPVPCYCGVVAAMGGGASPAVVRLQPVWPRRKGPAACSTQVACRASLFAAPSRPWLWMVHGTEAPEQSSSKRPAAGTSTKKPAVELWVASSARHPAMADGVAALTALHSTSAVDRR